MGHRIHCTTKHDVEYGNGYFSWQSNEFNTLMEDEGVAVYTSEDGNSVELDPKQLRKYIAKLRKRKPAGKHSLNDVTNADVIGALQDMLDSYDKNNHVIICEWF